MSNKKVFSPLGANNHSSATRVEHDYYATDPKALEMLLDEKNKKSGKTYRELATLGLIQGAIKGKSDNYRLILELMGELKQKEEENNNGILENLLGALNKAKESK